MYLTIPEHKQKPGKNVVKVQEEYPEERALTDRYMQLCDDEIALFTHVRDQQFERHQVIEKGYENLGPVTDIEQICFRQDIGKMLAVDLAGDRRLHPALNMLTLIHTCDNSEEEKRANPDMLARIRKEWQIVLDECGAMGGALGRLAKTYAADRVNRDLAMVERAVRKEGFDYLVREPNPWVREGDKWAQKKGDERIFAGMDNGRERPRMFGAADQGTIHPHTVGIDMSLLVYHGYNVVFKNLFSLVSPLCALYADAAWMNRRREQGRPVCYPTISTSRKFAIENAEPYSPVKDPVGCTVAFGPKRPRLFLNGLHSGGKTELLESCGLYLQGGLTGYGLPCSKAVIPRVRRIFHSFTVDKGYRMGQMQAEMGERHANIKQLTIEDALIADEFMQHASPAAAEPLEPVILRDICDTDACIFLVTHRGGSLSEDEWEIYSPGFVDVGGRITPTYEFHPGRPDQDILARHARQILEDAQKDPVVETSPPSRIEKIQEGWSEEREHVFQWKERMREIIFSGDYV